MRHRRVVAVLAVTAVVLLLIAVCYLRRNTLDPALPAPLRERAIVFKDASSNIVASGTIELPVEIRAEEGCGGVIAHETDWGCWGVCKIAVTDAPFRSTSAAHGLACLAQNAGSFSGRMTKGRFRISLAPLIADNTISLEGEVGGDQAKGRWFYQSFAGYDEMGTFETKPLP